MVSKQKSKSKFRESSDRNKSSKVSQCIPQTSDNATFELPPDGENCRPSDTLPNQFPTDDLLNCLFEL